jgi:hypothetical protein
MARVAHRYYLRVYATIFTFCPIDTNILIIDLFIITSDSVDTYILHNTITDVTAIRIIKTVITLATYYCKIITSRIFQTDVLLTHGHICIPVGPPTKCESYVVTTIRFNITSIKLFPFDYYCIIVSVSMC